MLILISLTSIAQTYETEKIISKADSILKVVVGEYLYQYYQYDSNSYYEYLTSRDKTNLENLSKKIKTKGKFIKTKVRFNFRHPDFDWILGYTSNAFDVNLKLKDTLRYDFVPLFVKENRPYDFISSDNAIKISRTRLKKKGIENIRTILHFDMQRQLYLWIVLNNFMKYETREKKIGYNTEYVNIDALTGEILEHYEGFSGALH